MLLVVSIGVLRDIPLIMAQHVYGADHAKEPLHSVDSSHMWSSNTPREGAIVNASQTTPDAHLGNSTCSCLRIDPASLQKHCSIKGRDWPADNNKLLEECIDFLTKHNAEYLRLHQHNTSETDCTKQLVVHTFWAGPMTFKLKAVIQSFLYTHFATDTRCRAKPVLSIWLQTVEPSRCVVGTQLIMRNGVELSNVFGTLPSHVACGGGPTTQVEFRSAVHQTWPGCDGTCEATTVWQ